MRCWKTSPCVKMAQSTLMMVQNREHRVSYPIYHIDNIVKPVSKAGHATKVIFLTADAFGVLPPVSRLTADQTQYHFSLASPPNWRD